MRYQTSIEIALFQQYAWLQMVFKCILIAQINLHILMNKFYENMPTSLAYSRKTLIYLFSQLKCKMRLQIL